MKVWSSLVPTTYCTLIEFRGIIKESQSKGEESSLDKIWSGFQLEPKNVASAHTCEPRGLGVLITRERTTVTTNRFGTLNKSLWRLKNTRLLQPTWTSTPPTETIQSLSLLIVSLIYEGTPSIVPRVNHYQQGGIIESPSLDIRSVPQEFNQATEEEKSPGRAASAEPINDIFPRYKGHIHTREIPGGNAPADFSASCTRKQGKHCAPWKIPANRKRGRERSVPVTNTNWMELSISWGKKFNRESGTTGRLSYRVEDRFGCILQLVRAGWTVWRHSTRHSRL